LYLLLLPEFRQINDLFRHIREGILTGNAWQIGYFDYGNRNSTGEGKPEEESRSSRLEVMSGAGIVGYSGK
jgi:hypothetical protein